MDSAQRFVFVFLLDFCVLQNGNRRCTVKEIRRTGQDHADSVLHVVDVVGADARKDCARPHRPGETDQHGPDDLATVRGPAKLGDHLWLWPRGTCELEDAGVVALNYFSLKAKMGCLEYFNFNSVQLALVLEDYEPPALRVQGFVSRK